MPPLLGRGGMKADIPPEKKELPGASVGGKKRQKPFLRREIGHVDLAVEDVLFRSGSFLVEQEHPSRRRNSHQCPVRPGIGMVDHTVEVPSRTGDDPAADPAGPLFHGVRRDEKGSPILAQGNIDPRKGKQDSSIEPALSVRAFHEGKTSPQRVGDIHLVALHGPRGRKSRKAHQDVFNHVIFTGTEADHSVFHRSNPFHCPQIIRLQRAFATLIPFGVSERPSLLS